MLKQVAVRIAFVALSILVCGVLLELLGRQSLSYVARRSVNAFGGGIESNPELLIEYTSRGRRLIPNADVVIHNHFVSGLDVDMKVNSLGLRDREVSTEPTEGLQRILVVGDSIISQDYLPSEKTLVRNIEQVLRSSDPSIEVINAGLSNTGLEEQQQLLEEIIGRLKPSAVLLSFYLNDSRPAWGFAGDLGTQRGWFRKHSIVIDTVLRELEVRSWVSSSKVDRFGWIGLADHVSWRSDPKALMAMIDAAPFDWGSAWSEDSWSGVQRGLERMKELVNSHGARFGVIAMPVRYQVEADYLEDSPQRRLGEILLRLGVPFESLLPVEREHRNEELFYDWCHPTEHGNRIIAPVIAQFISRNLTAGASFPGGDARKVHLHQP